MGTLTHRFDDRLLWQALAVSLALHLVLALLLPVWTAGQSGGLQPVESITLARIIRVEVQRPSAASLPVAVPQTKRINAHVSFARARSELTANRPKRKPRPLPQTGPKGGTIAAAPRHVANVQTTPLIARAPASSLPASSSESHAQQTPQPEVTVQAQAVAGNGVANRGGVMPLGERQDPVLDPSVRAQLAKLVRSHVTLTVIVGDDGHTKSVHFSPPLDAATQRQIETLLADAAWDAAVCGGGVNCEGTAVIRL